MIPSCVILNEIQLKKLGEFKEYLIKDIVPENYESEDVSIASPFIFKIFSTGIGDSVSVTSFGKTCNLTIDDDGEIINNDEWINY